MTRAQKDSVKFGAAYVKEFSKICDCKNSFRLLKSSINDFVCSSFGNGQEAKEICQLTSHRGVGNRRHMTWTTMMDRCLKSLVDSRSLVISKVYYALTPDDVWWKKHLTCTTMRKLPLLRLRGRLIFEQTHHI